jgi:hypothetical protein
VQPVSKWDAASAIVNGVHAAFNDANSLFRELRLEHTYTDLNALVEAINERQIDRIMASRILLLYRDWAPLAYWNRYKQVYTVHPGLTRELDATDIEDKIPGSQLQHLPHPDPLFVFPQGIPVELNTGERGRLTAIQVSGAVISAPGHARITSTTDEESNGLYLHAIAEVLDENGKAKDWDYCHTSIPFGETFTIASLIDRTRDHYTFDGNGISEGLTDERALAYVRRVVGIALSHVLYVVSRNAEIAAPRKTTTAQDELCKRVGGPSPRPVKHQPVGYVIGAALDAYRRNPTTSASGSGGGDRTVGPHVRKAHFHTVRYGKGRMLSYIDWFPPIPVKITGPATKPTIHGY